MLSTCRRKFFAFFCYLTLSISITFMPPALATPIIGGPNPTRASGLTRWRRSTAG